MRSDYLDNFNLPAGVPVKCKAAIACEGFTSGQTYTTLGNHQLTDDFGNVCTPSARFILEPSQ